MIPDHLVEELRYVELRAARRIRSLRVGTYTSPQRGDGFDFDQHRPYRPGDDVRRIDWNVTARLGAPFLRQTHAERELHVVIAVDLSRSMRLASERRSKHEALTLVTASILFSAVADQISVGFLGFTDRIVQWTPPILNKARAWAALKDLWAVDEPGAQTAFIPVAAHLLRSLKRMTIVFLVSDFLTDENLGGSRELAMLASRHDVISVILEDPAETRLPAGAGFVRVRDLESGGEMTVGLSDDVRALYADTVKQRRAELRRQLYRIGADYVIVDTQSDVVEPLLCLLDRRR